jgi:hypothetical protein
MVGQILNLTCERNMDGSSSTTKYMLGKSELSKLSEISSFVFIIKGICILSIHIIHIYYLKCGCIFINYGYL